MNSQEIILLKGLPASGKSTWSKTFVEEHKDYIRINKDDLREFFNNPTFNRKTENSILKLERNLGIAALDMGKSLIVDDTNFHPKHETFWKLIASQRQIKYSEKMFDTPLEECIKRDSERQKSTGKAVIMNMYNMYMKPKETSGEDV